MPKYVVATFARTWGFRDFAHVLANVATGSRMAALGRLRFEISNFKSQTGTAEGGHPTISGDDSVEDCLVKIGIISDTHDRVSRTRYAVQLLAARGAELLVHCGDWIGPDILAEC